VIVVMSFLKGKVASIKSHCKGFKRCPVELGEELEAKFAELSSKGEGTA
jgi:predicted RNA-binding protein with TRAM domain